MKKRSMLVALLCTSVSLSLKAQKIFDHWGWRYNVEIGGKPGPAIKDAIDKIYVKVAYGIVFGGRHAQ